MEEDLDGAIARMQSQLTAAREEELQLSSMLQDSKATNGLLEAKLEASAYNLSKELKEKQVGHAVMLCVCRTSAKVQGLLAV
jgi:hypothetical protein